MKDKIVSVRFTVFVREIPDHKTDNDIAEALADNLAISLMLKELDVNFIEINEKEYNIEARRQLNKRFKT